jgi:hypothetical protein
VSEGNIYDPGRRVRPTLRSRYRYLNAGHAVSYFGLRAGRVRVTACRSLAASSQLNPRSPSAEIPCTVLRPYKHCDSSDAPDALQCARTLSGMPWLDSSDAVG